MEEDETHQLSSSHSADPSMQWKVYMKRDLLLKFFSLRWMTAPWMRTRSASGRGEPSAHVELP